MARTLADMTPDERQSCVGMWCDYLTLQGDLAQVIYRWEKDGLASVHDPKITDGRTNQHVMVSSLTPRLDLIRAWTPDGQPVPGKWLRVKANGVKLMERERHVADYERFATEWMEAHRG